jgi:general secretion pathway protein M
MMRISARDRLFLAVGGGFVILFLILQFAVFPLLDERKRLQRGIEVRREALVEMSELQGRYRELHGKANTLQDQLSGRDPGFSLFSFMEQMAAGADVKGNIAYMRPSETAEEGPFRQVLVEMKLQEITLQQLVDFLKLLESPEKVVAVKRVSIQESNKEQATLDVIMQVISLHASPEEAAG